MRARFLYGLGLGLVALGLLTSFAGCHAPNPRHGFIFRGDWSLELNRIPWMAGRGADGYQQPSAPCDYGPNLDDSCQSDTCQTMISPDMTQICTDNTCVVRKCNPAIKCLAKPCIAKSSPAFHQPQLARTPSGGGNSRFLPVPTRPVFSRRTDGTNSIVEMPIAAEQADVFNSSPTLKLQIPEEDTKPHNKAATEQIPNLKPVPSLEVLPPPPASKP